ncbi:hypothetical protein [Brackiella oedipodis]|uniref:hypothetical protein n=1 Tax=Brackiella oedipodis TaxID=124225 RepID=UPI00049004A2|nr:hypothetical protein [Brackiella oedipodis]
MSEFLQRLLQAIVFFVVTLIGLTMAFIFIISAVIAVAILFVVNKLRGKPFSAQSYWQKTRHKAKQTSHFGERFKHKDQRIKTIDPSKVTDVDLHEIR